MRRREPRRTGADDRDLPTRSLWAPRVAAGVDGKMSGITIPVGQRLPQAILRIGMDGFDAELLRDVSLQSTDGDGCVDGSAAAGILAGSGAHPAADRSKRVGRARDEVCLFEMSFGDELHIATRVGCDRTAHLAFHLRLPVREVR